MMNLAHWCAPDSSPNEGAWCAGNRSPQLAASMAQTLKLVSILNIFSFFFQYQKYGWEKKKGMKKSGGDKASVVEWLCLVDSLTIFGYSMQGMKKYKDKGAKKKVSCRDVQNAIRLVASNGQTLQMDLIFHLSFQTTGFQKELPQSWMVRTYIWGFARWKC